MLETERLILRPTTLEDLDIYQKLLTCPITTQYLPGGKPFSLEYIEKYVPNKVKHWQKGYGTFVVSLKSNPSVKIGYAGVERLADSEFDDIRYGLLPEYQGLGYAFEAAKSVLDFTLGTGLVKEVYGVAVLENQPSISLLKKLVMVERDVSLYDADGLVTFSIRG